ncbi:MAG TPA: hypothetical protein VKU00_13530 [Chthonomonadaceae bacterium]|nr:hypothetical protein [Chthonomonadaceae bacterium]
MQTHIKVLGWLHIVLNILCVIAGIFILFACFAGGAAVAVSGDKDAASAGAILGGFGLIIGGFFLVIGLPGVVVGWGLLNNAPWSRIGCIILSILNLFNFPFGTALGVYGLVIMFNPEAIAIFNGQLIPRYPTY